MLNLYMKYSFIKEKDNFVSEKIALHLIFLKTVSSQKREMRIATLV